MNTTQFNSNSLLLADRQVETVMKRRKYSSFLGIIGSCCIAFILIVAILWWLRPHLPATGRSLRAELHTYETVTLTKNSPIPSERNGNCTFHNYTCIEVFHCGYDDSKKISIYIYPLQQYYNENGQDITPPMSREFEEILRVISLSPYYTPNPETACLFVPSIDLLNENLINPFRINQILASLKWWNSGKNHLLFNMLPGRSPDYEPILGIRTANAIIAGGGLSSVTYRRTFDITIPVYNPFLEEVELPYQSYEEDRKWFLLSSQFGLNPIFKSEIRSLALAEKGVVVLDRCNEQHFNYSVRCDSAGNEYPYPQVLQESTFCLVVRTNRLGQPTFMDVLMAGCIPVVIADGFRLPFHEVLDWSRASVQIYESQIEDTLMVLRNYSADRVLDMRRQIQFYWERYFKSLEDITMTTLQIFNDRVFPFAAQSYEDWNELPNTKAIKNPLFLPLRAPKALGFTAVVLTYDRINSLFQVIRQVGKVPSLAKVIVVWNNQEIKPPPTSQWPNIGKPIKVIQTKQNKLSNRFFPYDEIETECILALDDDIVMLTADEMEFGYEVWREFPDRLVGYPSRLHLWQNDSKSFSYESEWMNEISMVLTGAAFHHKLYSFLYTYAMPGNLKQWVDDHINCEDIAMNFLVTNVSGKAPIKVVPRKKFKCPECVKEMLSADLSHMVERSECINNFCHLYGSMPLKSIEFRADPVLYKDKMPGVLKKYSDLGTL